MQLSFEFLAQSLLADDEVLDDEEVALAFTLGTFSPQLIPGRRTEGGADFGGRGKSCLVELPARPPRPESHGAVPECDISGVGDLAIHLVAQGPTVMEKYVLASAVVDVQPFFEVAIKGEASPLEPFVHDTVTLVGTRGGRGSLLCLLRVVPVTPGPRVVTTHTVSEAVQPSAERRSSPLAATRAGPAAETARGAAGSSYGAPPLSRAEPLEELQPRPPSPRGRSHEYGMYCPPPLYYAGAGEASHSAGGDPGLEPLGNRPPQRSSAFPLIEQVTRELVEMHRVCAATQTA